MGVNSDGAVDRQLGLIRLERRNGELISLIANYAIHATAYTRSWAADSTNERIQIKAENDRGAVCHDILDFSARVVDVIAGQFLLIRSRMVDPLAAS